MYLVMPDDEVLWQGSQLQLELAHVLHVDWADEHVLAAAELFP
jgi:hypothetical protein